MANADYTYDQVKNGNGTFRQESGMSFSVRRMQTKLKRCGFLTGTADGYFGAQTTAAVRLLQSEAGIGVDGIAGQRTLIALDSYDNEPLNEFYGRELTHNELTGGYTTMATTEALARCIYGEYTLGYDGAAPVADEIYNRKNATQFSFGSYCPSGQSRTWNAVVFSPSQYSVMSGSSSSTLNSRRPNQYSTAWANCIALANQLTSGGHPNVLGSRYFHMANGSSLPTPYYNYIQIPAGTGNQFFNNSTTKY